MAPQTTIPVAATVLGTIGTVFWCVQLVPQIWYNWKQKKTDGLPGLMMFLWAISAVPFGAYAMIQNFNLPIQIQPQIFCALIVIEGGIFVSHGIWLFRTRKIRATAKAAGKTFDDLPESERYHVDIERKGSIAASRDIEHVEIERRGSAAVIGQHDLEAGISWTKSVVKDAIETLPTGGGGKSRVTVTEGEVTQDLDREGVSEVDYGTMGNKPAITQESHMATRLERGD
ncbi:hypothetical protein P7C71_g4495, partial [Lecanoromycetidae sp. Uapishka_2]